MFGQNASVCGRKVRHKPRGLKEVPTSKTAPSSKPEPPFGEEIQHEKLRVNVQQKAVLWSAIIHQGLKAKIRQEKKKIIIIINKKNKKIKNK